MAVRAYRTISDGSDDYVIEHTFECGQFYALDESTPGVWTVLWEDCDLGTGRRRTLYPFASGLKGVVDVNVSTPSRTKHWKYFPASNDDFTATLSMADINCGKLPSDPCGWLAIYQNGKKLPCSAYSINFVTAVITILEEWRVPGAGYEVIFEASPCGGVSSPGT